MFIINFVILICAPFDCPSLIIVILTISYFVSDAIRKNQRYLFVTDKEVQDIIWKWLKDGRDRAGRRAKRQNQKESEKHSAQREIVPSSRSPSCTLTLALTCMLVFTLTLTSAFTHALTFTSSFPITLSLDIAWIRLAILVTLSLQ